MTRLVDVKVDRKIIKLRNIRKQLLPLNLGIEEVADKNFASGLKIAIAKENILLKTVFRLFRHFGQQIIKKKY